MPSQICCKSECSLHAAIYCGFIRCLAWLYGRRRGALQIKILQHIFYRRSSYVLRGLIRAL
jgi:hypothetical protein